MTENLTVGDKVRVTFEGEISSRYTGSEVADVEVTDGNTIYDVPFSAIVVTKRKPPVEPSVGTVILYRGLFVSLPYKYVRQHNGWHHLTEAGILNPVVVPWTGFDHTRVFLTTASAAPVSAA